MRGLDKDDLVCLLLRFVDVLDFFCRTAGGELDAELEEGELSSGLFGEPPREAVFHIFVGLIASLLRDMDSQELMAWLRLKRSPASGEDKFDIEGESCRSVGDEDGIKLYAGTEFSRPWKSFVSNVMLSGTEIRIIIFEEEREMTYQVLPDSSATCLEKCVQFEAGRDLSTMSLLAIDLNQGPGEG